MNFKICSLLLALLATTSSFAFDKSELQREIKTPIIVSENSQKIEVIEFFSYMCPHCYTFEPKFNNWKKSITNKNVTILKIPVNFMPDSENLQKIYFTIESLKLGDNVHSKVFSAIHQNKYRFTTNKNIEDFLIKEKIDVKSFMDTFSSFSISNKVSKTNTILKSFEIESVPTLSVKGKYLFYGTDNSLMEINKIISE